MVICFFSTQYLPTPGGVERYTWNLARRCVAAGHRALVVTASLPGLPARERDADGIEIYRLPSWPVMGGRFPVLKPFADADDLWAQGIDFAVIQTRMYTQSVWAARQCKRRGIPALIYKATAENSPFKNPVPCDPEGNPAITNANDPRLKEWLPNYDVRDEA
mgnify:CR=1 FL=1